MDQKDKYDDIINLPHHVSKTHPPMPMSKRAAQFAPFSALVGYDEAIQEVSRYTDDYIALDDSAKQSLDNKIFFLASTIQNAPEVHIKYFIPDNKKSGGRYADTSGRLIQLDQDKKVLHLDTGESIPIHRVIQIDGTCFTEE